MFKITVKKKSGYQSHTGRPLLIVDDKGLPFYHNDRKNKTPFFNMPRGVYYSNLPLRKLKSPVVYSLMVLPKPEKNIIIKDYALSYAPNPNKATINHMKKTIVFDPWFKTVPKHYRTFVTAHELGHGMYNTEKYADLKAANLMLQYGYNPSQIAEAQFNVLTNRTSLERKEFLISSQLCKYYGR
jgi:hypothetical protein